MLHIIHLHFLSVIFSFDYLFTLGVRQEPVPLVLNATLSNNIVPKTENATHIHIHLLSFIFNLVYPLTLGVGPVPLSPNRKRPLVWSLS